MSSVPQFDDAVPAAETWLAAVMERLGWSNCQKAFQAVAACLHALRDYLPAEEAVYVGAHLPTLLRGVYYDGWHLGARPLSIESRSEFLDRIEEGLHRDPAIDAEQAARAVFAVLADRLPPGELEDAKAATPKVLRTLWPA